MHQPWHLEAPRAIEALGDVGWRAFLPAGGGGGRGWVCTVFEELEIFSENKAFRTSGSRICTISAA